MALTPEEEQTILSYIPTQPDLDELHDRGITSRKLALRLLSTQNLPGLKRGHYPCIWDQNITIKGLIVSY